MSIAWRHTCLPIQKASSLPIIKVLRIQYVIEGTSLVQEPFKTISEVVDFEL